MSKPVKARVIAGKGWTCGKHYPNGSIVDTDENAVEKINAAAKESGQGPVLEILPASSPGASSVSRTATNVVTK